MATGAPSWRTNGNYDLARNEIIIELRRLALPGNRMTPSMA
jgi:hypothetical protein